MPTAPAPPLPPFDLDGFLPYRMALAAQRLSEGLARQYRERFDISIAEWRVLAHVGACGDLSVRDVQARAGMEKSKVSRAAARLVARGVLEKRAHDGDRRLVRLRLTGQGRALMAQLLPVAEAYQADMRARLGPLAAGLEAALDALAREG